MMGSLLYFCQTPTELIVNGGFEQSKSLYPWVVETTKGGVLVSGPNENGYPSYTYYWTFGDGGTSTLQNPSHTYQTKGVYTATVKVTDSHSQTATKSLSIKVGRIIQN